MKRILALACAFFLVAAFTPAQTPRIDPAGIRGSLLVCGSGEPSEAAVEKFLTLSGGEEAKVLVVGFGDDENALPFVKRLRKLTEQDKSSVVYIRLSSEVKGQSFWPAVRSAKGMWLIGDFGADGPAIEKQHKLKEACRDLLERGGVLAASGGAVDVLASDLLPEATERKTPRFGLLPDSVIDARNRDQLKKVLPRYLCLVGYELEPGAALLVKGRSLVAVGDKKITVRVAPDHEVLVQGKTAEDLTALRRAARDRAQDFPPRKVAEPVVERGTLIIVGGGGQPEGMTKKFIEYAGGAGKANIVIFPTANPEPLPKKFPGVTAFWTKAGAKKVTVLSGRTIAEVESKESLDALKEATGLWFDGGRQWRFVDCYENTKAVPLMFDVLARGGVIGGSSAGATIQGDYLARGGVFNNFDIRYPGYERGLGFLKGVAIDQHFTQRMRQKDMTQLMKIYPQYLGIGIDEATAIVVQGSKAEVIGKGKVHFYDAHRKAKNGEADYEAIPAGGRYDLKIRKVLGNEK